MVTKYEWKLARRVLPCGQRTLVMGILNVTPDSFSDGGKFFSVEQAINRAEEMAAEGADIIDVGGESTRPGADMIEAEEELRRVVPVIEELARTLKVPICVDTTKAAVARAALDAGAEIVNDISGLRFDSEMAVVIAERRAGLVSMHSRGTPGQMHGLPPVKDILNEVASGLRESVQQAIEHGVSPEAIVLDPGFGFGKTSEQNIELLAKLDKLQEQFPEFPFLVGTSRKSFIGRILDNALPEHRVYGTMATVTAACLCGCSVVRVHDVRAAVETVRVDDAIKEALSGD